MPLTMPRLSPRRLLAGFLGALVGASLAAPVQALTDEEVYRTLRFSVAPPGARAMGMGGATIALADDPGAAYSNPAGLAFLDRPQLLVDFRGTAFDDTVESHSGDFSLAGLKTPASGTVVLEEDSVGSPHFLGYAHPVGEAWTFAISRHEWLSHQRDTATSYTSTAFPQLENAAPGVSREAASSTGSLDLLMDVYSVSVGWAPAERVALGLTLSAARLDVVATNDNYGYYMVDETGNGQFDQFLKPVDYRTVVDDDDLEFGFSAGVIWRPMDTLGIGLTYHEGPSFDVIENVRPDGERASQMRAYLAAKGVATASGNFINTISIPDSYGIGMAFGPYMQGRGGGGLTIAIDAVHVEYADLLDGYVAGLNNQLFTNDATGVTFLIEDETEFRFGMSYSWTVGYNNSIHVRAGAYSDNDHSVLTAGRGGLVGAQWGRDDIWHGTAGAGVTLKRGFYSFELDVAADLSDLGEQYFGSALFKF